MEKYIKFDLGSDPEFFYKKDGNIVGAETILPAKGYGTRSGLVIIDGVQAELNPSSDNCRESHLFRVAELIEEAHRRRPDGVELCFDTTVDISKEEMEKLAPMSQGFGCTPSQNIYGKIPMVKDPSTYYKRSAGGHIHLGLERHAEMVADEFGFHLPTGKKHFPKEDYPTIVRLLDILVGNTCVLLDRDEGNVERRKNYGRAGEYRTPAHGLEYRTLSNFWLYNYTMGHFVLGMCRFAVTCYLNGRADEIIKLVNEQDVVRAINENNFELAMDNFKKLYALFANEKNTDSFPLNHESMIAFLHMVEVGYKNVLPGGVESWLGILGNDSDGLKWDKRIGFESWASKFDTELRETKLEYYKSLCKSVGVEVVEKPIKLSPEARMQLAFSPAEIERLSRLMHPWLR